MIDDITLNKREHNTSRSYCKYTIQQLQPWLYCS